MPRVHNSMGYIDSEKNITSHYGIIINNDKPITGVLNINNIEWIIDDILTGIDTNFIEHKKNCNDCEIDDNGNKYHDICYQSDSLEGYLVGFILNEVTGKYDIDYTKEYSYIVNEDTIQIVHSKYVSLCSLCSPCYPGQGDADSPGKYLTYTLDEDIFGECKHLPILELSDIKKEE